MEIRRIKASCDKCDKKLNNYNAGFLDWEGISFLRGLLIIRTCKNGRCRICDEKEEIKQDAKRRDDVKKPK